jgi:cell division protein FtsB
LSELTEEQIRQIAREKLGLVSADDEVYYNVSSGK